MAIVQRLGAWMATDTLLLNASGQLAYDTSRSSPALWKLIARGAANLTVRVNGYLMFRCGASCSDVSVDLRGAKGSVRALSSSGMLELHGYTRREAVMRPGYMQLDAAALDQVSLWAAQAAWARFVYSRIGTSIPNPGKFGAVAEGVRASVSPLGGSFCTRV